MKKDISAGRLQAGDRLLLDGYVREIVRVERITVDDEVRCRVSFVNGASVTVPWTRTLVMLQTRVDPDR